MTPELAHKYRELSNRISIVRGRGAFGRKPNRSVVSIISESSPVQIHHHQGAEGGGSQFSIETVQDVEPVLKANVAEYNSGNDGYTPSRELQKVASIPLIEVHRLYQKGINIFNEDDWDKISSKLDSLDWLKYRTSSGRISRRPYREHFPQKGG